MTPAALGDAEPRVRQHGPGDRPARAARQFGDRHDRLSAVRDAGGRPRGRAATGTHADRRPRSRPPPRPDASATPSADPDTDSARPPRRRRARRRQPSPSPGTVDHRRRPCRRDRSVVTVRGVVTAEAGRLGTPAPAGDRRCDRRHRREAARYGDGTRPRADRDRPRSPRRPVRPAGAATGRRRLRPRRQRVLARAPGSRVGAVRTNRPRPVSCARPAPSSSSPAKATSGDITFQVELAGGTRVKVMADASSGVTATSIQLDARYRVTGHRRPASHAEGRARRLPRVAARSGRPGAGRGAVPVAIALAVRRSDAEAHAEALPQAVRGRPVRRLGGRRPPIQRSRRRDRGRRHGRRDPARCIRPTDRRRGCDRAPSRSCSPRTHPHPASASASAPSVGRYRVWRAPVAGDRARDPGHARRSRSDARPRRAHERPHLAAGRRRRSRRQRAQARRALAGRGRRRDPAGRRRRPAGRRHPGREHRRGPRDRGDRHRPPRLPERVGQARVAAATLGRRCPPRRRGGQRDRQARPAAAPPPGPAARRRRAGDGGARARRPAVPTQHVPDADLADLESAIGTTVRVGGLVVELDGDGLPARRRHGGGPGRADRGRPRVAAPHRARRRDQRHGPGRASRGRVARVSSSTTRRPSPSARSSPPWRSRRPSRPPTATEAAPAYAVTDAQHGRSRGRPGRPAGRRSRARFAGPDQPRVAGRDPPSAAPDPALLAGRVAQRLATLGRPGAPPPAGLNPG